MTTEIAIKNWRESDEPKILSEIREPEVNIAIYNRPTDSWADEVDGLMSQKTEFKCSGSIHEIRYALHQAFDKSKLPGLLKDIETLLNSFGRISDANSFRLFIGTVNSNMCRKFHTDINDLRLLCTYSGPGTLWLKEENINRDALSSYPSKEEDIVRNAGDIQQAKAGSVVILKGAIYPQKGTLAAVHRSPTIEETGEKRLLLRIDTNEFLNFL